MASCAWSGLLISMLLHASLAGVATSAEGAVPSEQGTVHFRPLGDQKNIPARYRLQEHTFDYEMMLKRELPTSGVEIYEVRFPSAVASASPENNTVYAEYYRPKFGSALPGVIVLDITAGDQRLSRIIAKAAWRRTALLPCSCRWRIMVPRRPPGSRLRLLSTNIPHTLEAVRQTVLDIRRATAWMETRPELDRERLGVHGTSLGSMVGALAAEMEPKLRRVSIALGGGGTCRCLL